MPMQANQMSVHEILEMIFQNKRLFFLCTVAGVLVSVLVFRVSTKWYASSSEILVIDRQTDDPNIRGLGTTTSVNHRFNMAKAKLLSTSNMVEMVPRFQLRDFDAATVADMTAQRRLEYLESKAKGVYGSIQMYLRGNVIYVRAERQGEGAAEEAQHIVEVLTNEMQSRYVELRETDINSARALLEKLLNKYRERLEEAEKYVENFSEINMVDLSEDEGDLRRSLEGLEMQSVGSKNMVRRLLDLIDRQDDTELRLRKLRAQREAVAKQVGTEPEYVTSEVTTAQSAMERTLEERLAQARAELAEVRMDRTDEHPLVAEKLAEVKRYEVQLEKSRRPVVKEERRTVNSRLVELRAELHSLDSEIAALTSEREGLTSEITQLTERIKLIPAKELRRSELVREMAVARSMYQTLRMRFENAELTHQLEIKDRQTRFETLKPPNRNPMPIRPNRKFIYILGTFLGAVVGLVLCFLREFTDTSFRNLDDASRFLDLPVLGVIPEVASTGRRRTRQVRHGAQITAVGGD